MIDEVFGERVRRYRQEHGRYQDEFGGEVADRARGHGIRISPVSRKTVRRWEQGSPPSQLYAVLISEVIGVQPSQLGAHVGHGLTEARVRAILDRAAGRRYDRPDHELVVPTSLGLGPSQDGLTLDWERLGTMLHATQSVDQVTLADTQRLTDHWTQQLIVLAPRTILPLLCSHLVMLRTMLVTTEQRQARQQLATLAGRTAIAAGNVWHGLHDLGEANEAYNYALRLAHEMGDEPLRGLGLTCKALLATRGLHEEGLPAEPGWAMALMQEAERAAGTGAQSSMRAWMLCTRAWEGAWQHDERAAEADLEAAQRALAQPAGQRPFFLLHEPDSQLLLYRAKCAALLGRPTEGARLLEDVVGRARPRSRALQLWLAVELAGILLQAKEIDHAASLLADLWQDMLAYGITKFIRRIQRFAYRELSPHREVAEVRALRERIAVERDGGYGLVPMG